MQQHVTFQTGGNPVSCAIGLAVLRVIENEQMLSSARCVGQALISGFKEIQGKHPMMGDVRFVLHCRCLLMFAELCLEYHVSRLLFCSGDGLLVGVEIVKSKESRKPDPGAVNMLCYK